MKAIRTLAKKSLVQAAICALMVFIINKHFKPCRKVKNFDPVLAPVHLRARMLLRKGKHKYIGDQWLHTLR